MISLKFCNIYVHNKWNIYFNSNSCLRYNVKNQTSIRLSTNRCSNQVTLINFPICFTYSPSSKVGNLWTLNLAKLSFFIASFKWPNFGIFHISKYLCNTQEAMVIARALLTQKLEIFNIYHLFFNMEKYFLW